MAQSNWRCCQKCQGLFLPMNIPQEAPDTPDIPYYGICPAGGEHDIGGSLAYILQDQPGDPGQHNWRYCGECLGLFFAGNPTTGWCPNRDRGHTASRDSGSWDYSLQQASATASGQQNWQWCHRCLGLFFAGNPTTGWCPAGGGHDYTGSEDYVVPFGVVSPLITGNPRSP
jgi:hypothetical protein